MNKSSVRDVLIIAFHFPPILQSSGVHRVVAFAEYLIERGFNVRVLTISRNALPATSEDSLEDLDSRIQISRAWGLDATRHLSIAGKYPGFLAVPDRYQSWILPAMLVGKRILASMAKPLLFSTFPVASAHRIALTLAKDSGAPWIADFRDPMSVAGETSGLIGQLERKCVETATAVTVTTDSTRQLFIKRYGPSVGDRLTTVENGFGSGIRTIARREMRNPSCPAEAKPIVMLHSGSVYNQFRDPSELLRAIAACRDEGDVRVGDIKFVFRGAEFSNEVANLVETLGVADFVTCLPMASHRVAVEEMAGAHAFLVLQGSQFNAQIPAKVYEYLALRRPILALTDAQGATAGLLRTTPLGCIANIHDAVEIRASLLELIAAIRRDPQSKLVTYDVEKFDRQRGAEALEKIILSF